MLNRTLRDDLAAEFTGAEVGGASSLRIAWFGPPPQSEGGVAGAAADILAGLVALGYEVDCFVSGREQPLPPQLQQLPGLKVLWSGSRWQWNKWYSKTPLAKFVTNTISRALGMRKLGRELVRRHGAQPYDLIYQFSNIEISGYRSHLKDLPPLVLHPETHLAGELRWFRREASLASRCEPLHRRVVVGLWLRVRAVIQRRDIGKAAGVICISQRFRTLLIEDYGVELCRTRVVPNPIRWERFAASERSGPETRPLRLLFIGRISVRKGIDTLIRLSHSLADLKGQIVIQLVGGHTLWSDYRPLLGELNPDLAVYAGPVNTDEVGRVLAEADLLIQPSKYEPFGLTVGEGLASGVPVVATDEVGAAEDLDPECCVVVPLGDDHALEVAVRTMVRRLANGERAAISETARREAQRRFDPKLVAKEISEFLMDISLEAKGSAKRG